MKRYCPNRSSRRQGFALISTLVLIAISALLLAGFSRLSLTKSLESLRAERQLQTRWAKASVERLIFSNASQLLTHELYDEENEQTIRVPLNRNIMTINFRDVRIEAVLANESSKLDLNTVGELKSHSAISKSIRRICGPDALPIQLAPKKRGRDAKDRDFVSWGQIFRSSESGAVKAESLIGLTKDISLWGKRICLNSSSDEVLREACKFAVGDATANRVVDARNATPGISVKQLFADLSLSDRHSAALSRLLTNSSISQSIWVKISHKSSVAKSYYLVVREGFLVGGRDNPATFRYQVFEW